MGDPDGCISAPQSPVWLIYVTQGETYILFFLVSLVIATEGKACDFKSGHSFISSTIAHAQDVSVLLFQ